MTTNVTITSAVQGQATSQPVVFMAPPGANSANRSDFVKRYAGRGSVGLGAVQICCGAVLILMNVIGFFVNASAAVAGTGFWSGVFFIVTGIFGVLAGKRKGKCLIVTSLVLSIIAAVFSIGPLTTGAIGAATDGYRYSYRSSYYRHTNTGATAVYVTFILAALVEGVSAIVSSGLACAGLCCGQNESGMVGYAQYYVVGSGGGSGQVVLMPTGGATVGCPSVPNALPQGTVVQMPQFVPPPTYTPGAYPAANFPEYQQPAYPQGVYPTQQLGALGGLECQQSMNPVDGSDGIPQKT